MSEAHTDISPIGGGHLRGLEGHHCAHGYADPGHDCNGEFPCRAFHAPTVPVPPVREWNDYPVVRPRSDWADDYYNHDDLCPVHHVAGKCAGSIGDDDIVSLIGSAERVGDRELDPSSNVRRGSWHRRMGDRWARVQRWARCEQRQLGALFRGPRVSEQRRGGDGR